MDKFSESMPDSRGIVPDRRLVGQVLRHANGKDYIVMGYCWLGEIDEWGFKHVSPEGVECVRPIDHLLGNRKDGNPRYKLTPFVRSIATEMVHHG